ncbi:MAG: amidohydrolase [Rubrivivax sp.]|jgi:mannonate dehydratase|nr:amidohydrolase [Rubrivivax sp.]
MRPGPSRRHFLCCGAALGAGLFSSLLAGCDGDTPLTNPCAGTLPREVAQHDRVLAAFAGIAAHRLVDTHAHLLGTGDSGSGCSVHPNMGYNPFEMLRKRAILNAACVSGDAPSVDRAYVERLSQLMADFPAGARWWLFAFEHAHADDGRVEPDWTTIHVPDAYTREVCAAQPQRLNWVASIHPYATDALSRLDAAIAAGATGLKWLPSAMNIDLRDKRCKPVYERLAASGMPLIVHCGEEKAVPGARMHELVNPLLVRVPLAAGVRTIVAHCASLGHAADTDKPSRRDTAAFDLFMRVVGEADGQAVDAGRGPRLLADISAVFQANREPKVWQAVVGDATLHGRLLHGSDYPLPGLMPLFSLRKLQGAGLLDPAAIPTLNAIRRHNPLMFDFVLKRNLRLGSQSLPTSVFEAQALGPARSARSSQTASVTRLT